MNRPTLFRKKSRSYTQKGIRNYTEFSYHLTLAELSLALNAQCKAQTHSLASPPPKGRGMATIIAQTPDMDYNLGLFAPKWFGTKRVF